jgi:peptide/nickel transport system permease protein
MRHLLRRSGFYMIALWATITLNFLIPRLAPGNPAQVLIARLQGRLDAHAEQTLEVAFGISHASLWSQYLQYLNNLAHGNLGLSISYFPTPVATVLGQDLPWTLVLVGVSVVISFALGTLLGALMAWRRGSRLDAILPPLMTFLAAIPYFWFALLLLYLLAFVLQWFPLYGGYDLSIVPDWSPAFLLSAVQHALLPALTIVISSLSGWMLTMRNTMITILSEDYILMGQAKGLSERRVLFRYAMRNAILPNITGFALALGFVVSGSLLTETVFSYPGIGMALLQAVQNADYALLQGIFLCIALAVLAANFLADMLYAVLDPRIRR